MLGGKRWLSMSEQKLLIMIVEDDEDMAQLNVRLLKRQGYSTLVAHTVERARELVIENTPDLFVLDIMLPDGDGFSLCSELRGSTDAPILFLTGRTKTEDKVKGLDSGGDYYLTKPYNKDEFLAVVKSLLRRVEQARKVLDGITIIKKGSLTLKLDEHKAYINDRDTGLSSKEFALLLLLVQNENKELTYDELYEGVWGMAMINNAGALRQQISRMKRKLGEENAADFLICNDHGRGYAFTTM